MTNKNTAKMTDELAELLLSIGWASPCDAQWTRLDDAIPEIRALLSAAQADQPGQPLVVDGVTIQTFDDWWAMNERYIDPTELMALCESVWNESRASIASPADKPVAWRCFHCEETFEDAEQAALHFGTKQWHDPECTIDAKHVRELEQRLERYQEEDTDLHRQMYAMRSEHQTALRREEEKGYARGLRDAAPVSPSPQQSESAAQQAVCPACLGTGRMVRDPDIGTDQECFACDGAGEFEDAAPSLQQKEAALPAPMPVAAFWYDPETSVERRRMTEYADQIVITGCNIRWGNYTTPFYAAPVAQQEPNPVAPERPHVRLWPLVEEALAWAYTCGIEGKQESYEKTRQEVRTAIHAAAPQEQPKPDAQALPDAKDAERPLREVSSMEMHLELKLREGPRFQCQAGDCRVFADSPGKWDTCPGCGRKGYLSGAFVRDEQSPQWKAWYASTIAKYRAAIDAAIAAKKEKP